jgi:hypothetical protein
VLEQVLEKKDGKQCLDWYWYNVGGQNAVNKYQAKALQVLGLMNGLRQTSVLEIAASLDDESENTRQILAQFSAATSSSVDEMMIGDSDVKRAIAGRP